MRASTKRSRYVALIAMGASALALSACGGDGEDEEETPAGVYSSVNQCIADQQFSEAECRTAFETAKQEHVKVAPKYASKEDCEADFGAFNCERSPYRASTGTSMFTPLFVGYMLGSSRAGQPAFTPQPLYRTHTDATFRTADNRPVGTKTGIQNVPQSTTSSASKSTTTNRGGFGSNASIYGSTSTSGRTTTSSGS